jgi:hypothetical protein
MAGYSATALAKKLSIKEGSRVLLVNAPEGYRGLLEPLPPTVEFVAKLGKSIDIVHVFATRKMDLAKALTGYRKQLDVTAAVWVSWPKKMSKVSTDITEDVIREVALPLGFVDIKGVCGGRGVVGAEVGGAQGVALTHLDSDSMG